MRTSFAGLALSIAVIATGCEGQLPDFSHYGSISVALSQTQPDGTIYSLTNAAFEISGPGGTQTVDGNSSLASVELTLPPGLTTIQLLDGWILQKTPPEVPIPQTVSALLGTSNPVLLRVIANQSATVTFSFIVRSATGDVNVTFGVAARTRELAGGVRIIDATGDFAPYLTTPGGNRADFAIYYTLARTDVSSLADGTKDIAYSAGLVDDFIQTPLAAEIFNDPIGILANAVAPSLAGGQLEYHVAARPDGTMELSGSFLGVNLNPPFTTINFGPHTLPVPVPLDANGFPTDAFFHDPSVPFTLTASFDTGDSTLTGFLNLRNIPSLP